MDSKSAIKLFETKQVRTIWNETEEEWYFSVVDVVGILTDSVNPTDYLKKLRKRDVFLGEYIGTNCPQVEMRTENGKIRKTLAAKIDDLFRIIQSIPSPNAEPFRQWLARVAKECIDQLQDPELSTKEISEVSNPATMPEHEDVARRGGNIAREARLKLEAETGKKVVSPFSAKNVLSIEEGLNERDMKEE